MTPPKGGARSEGRLSALSLRILSELDDGEWHDYEDVIEAVMYSIPPGEAFRHAQERSNAVMQERPMDDMIASGRRSRTVEIINNLVANRRVERNISTRSNEGKMIRVVQRVPQVYIVRDEADEIHVYPWVEGGTGQMAIHVLDLRAEPNDPKAEAEAVKKVFESLPNRMAGKEKVQQACRSLMNRYNIAATLRNLMGEGFFRSEEPDPVDDQQEPDNQPSNRGDIPQPYDPGGF